MSNSPSKMVDGDGRIFARPTDAERRRQAALRERQATRRAAQAAKAQRQQKGRIPQLSWRERQAAFAEHLANLEAQLGRKLTIFDLPDPDDDDELRW